MIRTKRIEKRVYSIVLKGHTGIIFLWLGTAFTLDEALLLARDKARFELPYEYFTLLLQEYLTMQDVNNEKLISKPPLVKQLPKVDPKIEEQTSKNVLMKKIIESRDIGLLGKNKSKFTANEIRLLEEQLKNSGKK